jgi:multifunctional methyltransferase subunit TRM112
VCLASPFALLDALWPLQLGVATLPDSLPDTATEDEGFLRSVHGLIMDVHVEEGSLVCPHCGRAYPINKGVPNMLLREDEV